MSFVTFQPLTTFYSDANQNEGLGYRTMTAGLNPAALANSGFGYDSMFHINTGNYNSAFGAFSLSLLLSGNRNSGFGYQSLFSLLSGSDNTAVGKDSLFSCTTGFANTAVGLEALTGCTTGAQNTAVGNGALLFCATDNGNTAVGDTALLALAGFTNCTGLGASTAVTGSNQVQLGDAATTTYAYGAVQNRSDARDKTAVRDTTLGLDFIRRLRPVDFKWDMREFYRPAPLAKDATDEEKAAWLEANRLANIHSDGSKARSRYHHGLIAQEVKAVIEASGVDFGGFQDHSIAGGDDVMSIGYAELIGPLIKAVQELTARIERAGL